MVYIRADDPNFRATEIAGHEIGHELINRGTIDMDSVISEIRGEYTKEELSKIADEYGVDLLVSGMDDDALTNIIIEEITCDSLGGMNAFASNREGRAEFIQKMQGLAEKHYTGKGFNLLFLIVRYIRNCKARWVLFTVENSCLTSVVCCGRLALEEYPDVSKATLAGVGSLWDSSFFIIGTGTYFS